jgi:hypothetical protein
MNISFHWVGVLSFVGAALGQVLMLFGLLWGEVQVVGQSLSTKGQWTITADVAQYFVKVQGNYAYVFLGNGKLRVVDVSDATRLNVAAELTVVTNSSGCGLTVSGNYLYAVGRNNGNSPRLFVVDITDPTHPVTRGSIGFSVTWSGSRIGLTYLDGKLYVPGGLNGLLVFDVSNPAAPSLLKNLPIEGKVVMDVKVANGLAYLAMSVTQNYAQGGLEIYDVTDPANPWRVGGVSGFDARNLTLRGNYAYLCGERNGASVYEFDVSNPVLPVQAGLLPLPETNLQYYLQGITSTDNHLFVSIGFPGFAIIDVSAAPTMTKVRNVDTPVFTSDVAVSENKAYVADEKGGFLVFDVQDVTQPVRLGSLLAHPGFSDPKAVVVSGNLAFVRDLTNGVIVLDVSDATLPQFRSNYYMDGVGPTAAAGSRAYMGTKGGFDVVDISDPSKPLKLGQYRNGSVNIADLVINGNYIYTPAGEVVDVRNPGAPQKVGSLPLVGGILKISGNRLFALLSGNSPYFYIFDLSQPAAPMQLGRWTPADYYYDFAISGAYAYCSAGNALDVVDISIPQNCSVAARRLSAGKGYLELTGSKLFHVSGTDLFLYDITDPISPVAVTSSALNLTGLGLAVTSDYAFTVAQTAPVGNFRVYASTLGPQPLRPSLSATAQTDKVIIRWPATFPGMKLYSAPGIGQAWTLVTSTPYLEGSTYVFTNTRPLGTALFYKISSN